MSLQTIQCDRSYDQVNGGSLIVNVQYDDVSLLVTDVQYENTTTHPATVSWNNHTATLPVGTGFTTTDVSSLGEHVTMQVGNRGNTFARLPGTGVTVVWPA